MTVPWVIVPTKASRLKTMPDRTGVRPPSPGTKTLIVFRPPALMTRSSGMKMKMLKIVSAVFGISSWTGGWGMVASRSSMRAADPGAALKELFP